MKFKVTKSRTFPKLPGILISSFFGSGPNGVCVRKILLALVLFCSLLSILPAKKKSGVEKLIQEGKIDEAKALCSQLQGFSAAWNWPLLGDHFYQAGNLEMALDCYGRGIPVVGLARTWSGLADRYLKQGEKDRARESYGRALQTYATLIRDDRCIWDPTWNDERQTVRMKWQQLGGDETSRQDREKLRSLLNRAAAYCRRLEEAMLHFICEEAVTETIDHSQPLASEFLIGGNSTRKQTTKRLYDYLLINKSGSTIEKRILLRKSGKPSGLEESDLYVSHYRLSKMIYSPIELFASGQSQAYEYHILEERNDEAGPLVVVEVLPRLFTNPPHNFGKAWLRENGRVERIELNLKSIQNYEVIIRSARAHNLVPAISFVICLEKIYKGLGFPSAIHLRDAFLDENGNESLASYVDISYDRFGFYMVEVREDIQEKKSLESSGADINGLFPN